MLPGGRVVMRRALSLIAAAWFLSACSGGFGDIGGTEGPVPLGETLALSVVRGGGAIAVTPREPPHMPKIGKRLEPTAGDEHLVAFRMSVENVGDVKVWMGGIWGTLIDTEEGRIRHSYSFDEVGPSIAYPTIEPGDVRVGLMFFRVPDGWRFPTLQIHASALGDTGEWSLR
jgi:hypothetical protein